MRILTTRIVAALLILLPILSESVWPTRSTAVATALFFGAIFLVAIASLGRMWCSLYIAGRKDSCLVTQGPYSICRNPLYMFSFLGAVGVGMATGTLMMPALIAVLFAVYYPFTIRNEEEKLQKLYGEAFTAYCRTTPRILPRLSLLVEPKEYTVNPRVYRNHIASALWFIWSVGILKVIAALHAAGILPVFFHML